MDAEQASPREAAEPQAVLDSGEVLDVLETNLVDDDDSARAIAGIRNGVLISAGFWAAAGLVFAAFA